MTSNETEITDLEVSRLRGFAQHKAVRQSLHQELPAYADVVDELKKYLANPESLNADLDTVKGELLMLYKYRLVLQSESKATGEAKKFKRRDRVERQIKALNKLIQGIKIVVGSGVAQVSPQDSGSEKGGSTSRFLTLEFNGQQQQVNYPTKEKGIKSGATLLDALKPLAHWAEARKAQQKDGLPVTATDIAKRLPALLAAKGEGHYGHERLLEHYRQIHAVNPSLFD